MGITILKDIKHYPKVGYESSTFLTSVYAGNYDKKQLSVTGNFAKQPINTSTDQNWLSAILQDPVDSTNTYKEIKITVSENTSTNSRTGKVYLKYNTYTTSNYIEVIQAGKSATAVTEIKITLHISEKLSNGTLNSGKTINGHSFFGTDVMYNSMGPGVTYSERGDSIVYHIPTPPGEYSYIVLRSFLLPLLLILGWPFFLPELFFTISNPASFCICLGSVKRPISPASATKPITVLSPTPFMASSFSTFGTSFTFSSRYSSSLFSCSALVMQSFTRIQISSLAASPASSPTLFCAASTRVCALFIPAARTLPSRHI